MPKRTDLESILIIGAGPIVIGQACEFDYSGAQACKALREEGYRVILVNSNPATIMTDPGMADATYIEPITWQVLEKIIANGLKTFAKENCLMDQVYVHDGSKTVTQIIGEVGNKAGAPVKLLGYIRMQLGEGIEKQADDFAAEVAKAAQG